MVWARYILFNILSPNLLEVTVPLQRFSSSINIFGHGFYVLVGLLGYVTALVWVLVLYSNANYISINKYLINFYSHSSNGCLILVTVVQIEHLVEHLMNARMCSPDYWLGTPDKTYRLTAIDLPECK